MSIDRSIPRHVNPPNNPPSQPIARAPYNFVPLPQAILTVDDGIEVTLKRDDQQVTERVKPWERHDEFVPGTHSGWIDLHIEALTPVFIRGPMTQRADGTWDMRESRLRSAPFLDHQGRPTIPGSTLRGMLRNLVEILTYSKIQPVSNKRPFFRKIPRTRDDRIGIAYQNNVVKNGIKPAGGFAERRGDDWVIVPTAEVLRIPHSVAPRGFDYQQAPNYHPDWQWQHRECWFQRGERNSVRAIRFTDPAQADWQPGIAVLTGSSPQKKAEFLFVGRDEGRKVKVPPELIQRFNDDDQITGWQTVGFPVDRPTRNARRRDGELRHGEPVFYVCDEAGDLQFFGRAQMFRFPYDRTPAELVPVHLRSAGLDLAEAMFGRVPVDPYDPLPTVKGRVFCEDCIVMADGEWREHCESEIVPPILGLPKITAYQQYLTQDGSKGERQHTAYIAGDKTTIRGHKLYWHRWDESGSLEQVKQQPATDHSDLMIDLKTAEPRDSQHTLVQPVRTGTTFTGRVRFENLTDIELGALLAALNLPDGCAHKIGMAKPLGFGSIRIKATLNRIDRAARYTNWNGLGTSHGTDQSPILKAFTSAIVQHAVSNSEATISSHPESELAHLARLDALFTVLRWENRPQPSETRYMKIEGGDPKLYPEQRGKVNEFRTHPVLPTPHAVAGDHGPQWASNEPNWPGLAAESATDRSPKRSASQESRSPGKSPPASSSARFEEGGTYTAKVDGIKKGKLQVHVELGPENWKFGFVANTPDVPESLRVKGSVLKVGLLHPPVVNNCFHYLPDA